MSLPPPSKAEIDTLARRWLRQRGDRGASWASLLKRIFKFDVLACGEQRRMDADPNVPFAAEDVVSFVGVSEAPARAEQVFDDAPDLPSKNDHAETSGLSSTVPVVSSRTCTARPPVGSACILGRCAPGATCDETNTCVAEEDEAPEEPEAPICPA